MYRTLIAENSGMYDYVCLSRKAGRRKEGRGKKLRPARLHSIVLYDYWWRRFVKNTTFDNAEKTA
jgi:hypothetical protein